MGAYVEAALRSNLGLQQREIDLEKGLRALDEARGMFLPGLSVEARYSVARGGRTIDLPLGDLMNPVYSTLNRMLEQQGEPAAFPTLANQEISFLREREQDTRVRITQPLYQPRLLANVRLRKSLVASQEAAVEVYRNTLTRDVKKAYFTYLKAERAVEIYEAAAKLTAENLRTNESLYRNAKVTNDAVLRANTEVLTIAQELAGAEKNRAVALSYFNFLLNRDLDTPVERQTLEDAAVQADVMLAGLATPAQDGNPIEAWAQQALAGRRELDQLDAAIAASEAGVRLARAGGLPSAALALDAGIQGENYRLAGEAPYAMASVVLSWNLFSGRQNRMRQEQARLELERTQAQRDEVEQQIALEVQDAYYGLQVARRSLRTAEERVGATREGYRLVARRYDEGLVNQVALLDARTSLTGAELNLSVLQADLLIQLAELEYSAALGLTSRRTMLSDRR